MVKKKSDEIIIDNEVLSFENSGKGNKTKNDNGDEAFLLHLASIVESSDDAIISKSLDGLMKSWNKGSEKMFGYTSSEVIGKNISLIIPKEYLEMEKEILERIQNNETIAHYETVRLKKNGEQFYVSITASPLKDKKGNIIGISKIARDITSQKNAQTHLFNVNKELAYQNEEKEKRASELVIANKELTFQNEEKEKRAAELIIANKELAYQNEEKEKRASELIIANKELAFQSNEKEKRAWELIVANKELIFQNDEKEKRAAELINAIKDLESFSYSVSHDLRSPLRAVHGYAQMLLEDYGTKLDTEAHRLMNNIMKNAKKMGQLIDDLLTFSRIGRKELVKINISMKDMVNHVCDELKDGLNPASNPEICIKELPFDDADKVTIKQVWVNLISNAIKYSKLKVNPVIEIGATINGDEIIYYIKDNGAGFDMRYANNLFGVFQRLHSESEFEGTGVGLAIVQKIVLKHGGKIWAEAKLNEGATFYFTLK